MNDSADFIRAIMAAPEDEAIRLIYADWLDEHDRTDAAAKLRQPGRWEIQYSTHSNLYWSLVIDRPASYGAGAVPADVPVDCEQCHISPMLAILVRVFLDDEWPQRRWLCRFCLDYERAVTMANILDQQTRPCQHCCHPILPHTHSEKTCLHCRNFRVVVSGGVYPATNTDQITVENPS